MVINMNLGGSQLDALEKGAIDYAIANGVAGNSGTRGMEATAKGGDAYQEGAEPGSPNIISASCTHTFDKQVT